MAFTIKDFICDKGFSNLKLLTCEAQIDTLITGVNVIDNPDVALWVKPGELVLTTGYFFANDKNLQTNVIMNLKNTGCSALCIKMKRFFPEVPENIIKTAERAGLPIIDLPLEYTFSEITQKIHEELNNCQISRIQQEQMLFNSLLNAFHTENSIQNCLKLLSDFLSVSLFIVDEQLQCLFLYLRPEEEHLISPDTFEILALNGQRPVLSPDTVNILELMINSHTKNVVLIPFQDQVHFLCIPDGNSIPLDIIQRSMKLLSFPKEQFTRTPAALSEYYCDFFRLLISTDTNQNDIDRICEYYGYPHCKAQLCVLFSLRHDKEICRLQSHIAFLKETLHTLSCKPSSYFLAYYQRQICLFFFSDKESCCQTALQCVQEFQKKYRSFFSAGISQLIWGDRELKSTYQQASFLLSLTNVFPEKDSFFFKDYIIFWNIKALSSDNRQKIYQDTIKPLIDYDGKNNTDLIETLLEYFNTCFNASLAAKQLYVHRNTFLKRMQKINELVSFNPDDINSLLSLYYGICIYLLERGSI